MELTGMMACRYRRCGLLVFLVLLAILLFAVAPASAHRVTLFAWVEGDVVHTVSKFSGGKMVKNGRITVYDLQGNQLLEGEADGQGDYSFAPPKKTALRIVLNAGMGHRAEWILDEKDMGLEVPDETTRASAPSEGVPRQEETMLVSASAAPGLTAEEIQLAMERALDKELRPVVRMIAETRAEGPSVRDVVGGLGYIMGLVGMAAYFHSRRNRKGS